jgi:uroporphyrinogen decarboxylase
MNPCERFDAVVNHREPDRVPVDLGRHVGSLHRGAYARLASLLKDPDLKNHDKILDRMVQNVFPDEKLLQKFNVDFRWLVPNWVGVEEVEGENAYRDMWGIKWTYMLNAFSLSDSPLKDANIHDLGRFNWPDPCNPDMFAGLQEQARHWYENTDYVIVADSIKGGLLTKALQIRGYEGFFTDLIENTPFAEALLDKLLAFYKDAWSQYLKEVGKYAQVVYFTDDVGGQNAMLISPATFRSLIKPRLRSLIDHIKGQADVRFMYHTDGSVAPVIEDFIEMGVDILNPIQTSAMGMDTFAMKETYGDRLCFHGAIDVQQMLPFSTPEEVRYDVAKRIYDLGRSGGYILSTCHDIGEDVPPENVIALFEAAEEYGRYPLTQKNILKPEDINPEPIESSLKGVDSKTVRRPRRPSSK